MSDSSVITNDETDPVFKRGVNTDFGRVKFALLDPMLTATVSKYQTACGATDIMMHTLERYFHQGYALDFTDQPVEAYIVTAKNGNSFNKKQVYKVPAETGLVVEGAEGTYKIPVAVGSQFDDFTGNLLQSTATAPFTVPDDGNAYYGLFYSFATERVGFQKKSAGFTFGQGKSYLLLPESMAEANINEIFCDETTTIQGVVNDTWTDDKAYNLNGQRVDKNYKGIIIMNGKKVVNNRK
jgi:hypothetical protein